MKQILPFLFMLLFLAVLPGPNIYLSRRFAWYFDLASLRPQVGIPALHSS